MNSKAKNKNKKEPAMTKELKTENILFRVTKTEKGYIEARAKIRNYKSVGQFITDSLIIPENLDTRKMSDMVYELNRIGINLNQAIRKMHKEESINEELINAVKEVNLRMEMVINTYKKL